MLLLAAAGAAGCSKLQQAAAGCSRLLLATVLSLSLCTETAMGRMRKLPS